MKNVMTFAAALLLAAAIAQPASAQSPAELVGQAVAAQGGADALRGLKTLVIKGEAKHWEPGQSVRAGGEARFIGDSTFTVTADIPNQVDPRRLGPRHEIRRGRAAASSARSFTGPTASSSTRRARGRCRASGSPRTSANTCAARRSCCCARWTTRKSISAIEDQRLGEQAFPAVAFHAGTTRYIVLFDRTSKLPVAVRTRDDDHIYGDSDYDLVLGDWKSVGGAQACAFALVPPRRTRGAAADL